MGGKELCSAALVLAEERYEMQYYFTLLRPARGCLIFNQARRSLCRKLPFEKLIDALNPHEREDSKPTIVFFLSSILRGVFFCKIDLI
jgi:hypothetical protein